MDPEKGRNATRPPARAALVAERPAPARNEDDGTFAKPGATRTLQTRRTAKRPLPGPDGATTANAHLLPIGGSARPGDRGEGAATAVRSPEAGRSAGQPLDLPDSAVAGPGFGTPEGRHDARQRHVGDHLPHRHPERPRSRQRDPRFLSRRQRR